MSYPFSEFKGKRVRCPGCHKSDEDSPLDGGVYDSKDFATFYCSYCQSIFAVCNYCGESSPSGDNCNYCGKTKYKGYKAKQDKIRLPVGTKAAEFKKDPSGRPGHWIHIPTGIVYDFAPDWINE